MNSPENTQQEQSLQDALAEEFDRMEAEGTEEEHEEVEVSSEEDTEIPETTDEESETETVDETEEIDEQLVEEIAEAEESDYNEPAPERWPDDIKKVYNELPPVARKAMLEGIYKPMQRSYTQTTQELARMRQGINPMLEAMQQYQNDFDRMGVNPVEAFRTQMAWAAHLARVGPEQGLADMRSAYGLDAQAPGQQTPQEYLTPAERALKARLDQLEQGIQGHERQRAEEARTAEESRQAAFKHEIERNLHAFSNEKLEDGSLAHPHVERVANGIAGVIRGGMVRYTDDYGNAIPMRDMISQAYEMACNLDPTIRTQSVASRQVPRAKAAQKVGVVTKEPAGQVSESSDMPMEDFISKVYDQLDRAS